MRRVVSLALGLVLSTLLLGGGWMLSSLRERAARMEVERGRLERAALAVQGVVDESLDELRVREDHRPFYLYNHLYSPPDVLAISDPIAVSPLAQPPADPRVVGHFQFDATGVTETPYENPNEPPSAQSTRIVEIVSQPEFDALRALAVVDPDREAAGLGLGELTEPEETDPSSPLLALRLSDNNRATAPESLTVGLNNWGNIQAQDIVAAQQGDPIANQRIMERGQQMPRISRRNVSWEDVETRQQAQQAEPQQEPPRATQRQQSSGTRPTQSTTTGAGRTPQRAEVERAMEQAHAAVEECAPHTDVQVSVRLRGSDGQPATVVVQGEHPQDARRCVAAAVRRGVRIRPFSARELEASFLYRGAEDPSEPSAPALPAAAQGEAEVEYTFMVFRRLGDQLVLTRIVTHEGVSIVQGVLLDREHLETVWIPHLVDRHAQTDVRPTLVARGQGDCSVRGPASAHLDDLELCFAPAAMNAAVHAVDSELGWQAGALFALLFISMLAALAIVLAARRADALSRQKSAFVSAVSHELRTPLTTIRMHAEMLDEGLVKESRRDKVHRELVRESVRLARLVDNVLSLSLLEEGQRQIHRAEGDLSAHVREVAEGQRGFVEERGFELVTPKSADPISASFDAQAIDQIVVNLIDNAVKYGGGERSEIEVWVGRHDGQPALAVKDRGRGIPEKERARVFERFHRVERQETAHAPGTGIGLALVSDLAAAHGGTASVHDREGGGLEVRITLSA